jgi:hypothetical protein
MTRENTLHPKSATQASVLASPNINSANGRIESARLPFAAPMSPGAPIGVDSVSVRVTSLIARLVIPAFAMQSRCQLIARRHDSVVLNWFD